MKLKNLGIYLLPDGREYVADVLRDAGYSLCPRRSWDSLPHAEFRVAPDGRLVRRGKPTIWHVGQLTDTGRRAQYPSVRRLL
jgi:hypothetical protein